MNSLNIYFIFFTTLFAAKCKYLNEKNKSLMEVQENMCVCVQVNRYFVNLNIRQNVYHMGMGMARLFLKLFSSSILVCYAGKSTCYDF